MAKKRKSIQLVKLIERTNRILAHQYTETITAQYKQAAASMLEFALVEANAYEGYRYLDNMDCHLESKGYWNREYYMPRD